MPPAKSMPGKAWAFCKTTLKTAFHRYQDLHGWGKVFIWLVTTFYIVFGIFIIIVTPARIFQFLYDQAEKLAKMPLGWLILVGAITFVSFPPMLGHTTTVTLCGFAYGMKGFVLAATASLFASALVFVLLRFFFSHRLRRMSATSEKWQALESIIRAKGLPLIILIRISSFPPWVYSNSLFASIEPVALWQFATATLFVFPKLLLHVFIGSRLAALSDGDTRREMDTSTKVLNGVVIGVGALVAVFTSWLIYTLVQKHVRELEEVPPDVDRLAAEAIEEYDEGAPLLKSSDEED